MLRMAFGIVAWFSFLVAFSASFIITRPSSNEQHNNLFLPIVGFDGHPPTPTSYRPSSSGTTLRLSWFQDLVPEFLKKRQGDFTRLEESDNAFGPGPLLLLYNVPSSIDDEEFQDMIADGSPNASGRCALHRIVFAPSSREEDSILAASTIADTPTSLLDCTLEEALQRILENPSMPPTITQQDPTTLRNGVLLFSGFSNTDMLAVYNIMAEEIYEETGGTNSVACAKAVPNAMHKPLGQVFEEICGDHQDAIKSS